VVALSFLCLGGHYSCFPAAAVRIFGIENGGQIYTIITYAMPVAAMSSFAMVQSNVNYANVFHIAAVLTLLNIILLYFFDETEIRKDRIVNTEPAKSQGKTNE